MEDAELEARLDRAQTYVERGLRELAKHNSLIAVWLGERTSLNCGRCWRLSKKPSGSMSGTATGWKDLALDLAGLGRGPAGSADFVPGFNLEKGSAP